MIFDFFERFKKMTRRLASGLDSYDKINFVFKNIFARKI